MDTSAVINVNVQSNDTPQAQYKTVVLKPNMVDDVNTLTQAMLTVHGQNTKFVIKYDFTLGEDITVPANCVLEFDGGSVSGEYILTGNNTDIQAGLVKIFNTDVTLDGTWNVAEAYPEWFGAKGDGITDDTLPIQKCIDNVWNTKIGKIYFTKGVYNITSIDITGKSGLIIQGCGRNARFHNSAAAAANPNSMLRVKGATSVGLDLIESYGIIIENLELYGDENDTPQTLMLLARPTTDKGCASNIIRGVEFNGYVSKFMLAIIGAELNKFYDIVCSGYAAIACVGILCANHFNIVSPFKEIITNPESTTTNSFHNCDFLNYANYGDDDVDRNISCVYITAGQGNLAIRDSYMRSSSDGTNRICHAIIIDGSLTSGNIEGFVFENIRQEGVGRCGSLIKNIPNSNSNYCLEYLTVNNCFCNTSVEGIPLIDINQTMRDCKITNIKFMNSNSKKIKVGNFSSCILQIPYGGSLESNGQFLLNSFIFGAGDVNDTFKEAQRKCIIIADNYTRSANGFISSNKTYPGSYDEGIYKFVSGKPIFWNGTAWVDATGTPV